MKILNYIFDCSKKYEPLIQKTLAEKGFLNRKFAVKEHTKETLDHIIWNGKLLMVMPWRRQMPDFSLQILEGRY